MDLAQLEHKIWKYSKKLQANPTGKSAEIYSKKLYQYHNQLMKGGGKNRKVENKELNKNLKMFENISTNTEVTNTVLESISD